MVNYIIKRDGTREEYDINKIKKALNSAFINTKADCSNFDEIIQYINDELFKKEVDEYNIEDIQDLVERTLMIYKYFDTAKHYINYRTEHNKNRNNTSYLSKIPDNIKTPWGMLGYITYKRTYARRLNEKNENDETTEEYRDTILRVLQGCQKQLNVNFNNIELEKAYKYLMSLKCSVAGRFLWQLGTETIGKLGIMSLQNCAFVKIDEPIRPFLWIFDVLMLGTGVGFNIQNENIDKLPPILNVDITITRKDTKDADFIVPDSREGWVYLLEKVLEAYFYKGNSFTYSTMLIRSAGTKIKGFGGVASGPEDLVKGINTIQGILNNRKGHKLTSVDCLDIINIIASVVVAGNVRRCIPKGAKIHTKLGLINIEDINIGDEVLTTRGYKRVKNVFNQGEQEIYKIITENGIFKCTKNHKMAVYDKNNSNYQWITTENLNQGDNLIMSKKQIDGNENIKLPSFPYNNRSDRIITPDFTYDIAWLFGYIPNNSFFNEKKKSIIIDCGSRELLNTIVSCINKFGSSLRIITDIDVLNNRYVLKIISHRFYEYINTYFIHNIPDFINETIFANRMYFINGILEGNSTIIENNYIKIDNISNENDYLSSLSHLMFSCGIINKPYDNYIIINDPYSINKLKQFKLVNKTYPDVIGSMDDIISINYTNIALSEIERIEYDSIYQTYDIEVEEVHEFFCNGFLTHNSALICLGDYDDIPYLNAKRWDLGNIPNWRCMSNNSVVCNDISKLPEDFWNGYNGNGEPYGLINIELAKKIGRIKDGDKYPDPLVEGFNPCLTSDTIIMTDEGLVRIEDLINKKFKTIINDKIYESTNKGFWYSGKKEVYKLYLKNGIEIKATNNHKFMTSDNWKEVKDMKIDDILYISNNNYKWTKGNYDELEEGYIIGHLINNHDDDNTDNEIKIFVDKHKYRYLKDYLPIKKIISYCNDKYKIRQNENYQTYDCISISSDRIDELMNKYDFYNNDYLIKNASYDMTIGILKAIFDINGYLHIQRENIKAIVLKDLNTHKLKIIQQMLLSLGIYNSINTNQRELIINEDYVYLYKNLIGFYDNNKNYKLNHFNYKKYNNDDGYFYSSRIVKIEKLDGYHDVYDCTINDIHAFNANNLISHNCAEQSLANYETCCLSEIYLCNIDNYEELKEIAEIVYRICKHSLLLKCHHKETENIVHKNLRMGIGITGYLQSSEEQKSWLNPLYEYLREYDVQYSNKIGVPTSVKLTTVKPSGTLSLLAGVTSGAHPAIYQYFIRRIRISSSNHSLIELARSHHYHIEYQKNFDGTDDKNTMIIEFPCCYPEGTILAKDMTAIDQLNTIKQLQTNWSDNSVSVTVYYRLHELDDIKEWLRLNYNNNVKTCSFLLHNEHGFKQAPFEEITKEKYEELIKKVIPITSGKINTMNENELMSDCVGGVCPIR
jgi:ribonucleotide reductase alpha subunit